MASVGLCVITKSYTKELADKIDAIQENFDAVYIQVNGALVGEPARYPVNISRFKWNDNFSDARNALLKEVKTDYWIWMDSDDEIKNVELIPDIVGHMERNRIDIMFAPYHYVVTSEGTQELQNRERIIRTSLAGSWHGAIHETWIPETPAVRETTNDLQWVHVKTKAEHDESMLRNRGILELEYRKEPRDPRVAYYLGLNYGMAGEYDKAIPCFQELIDTGGWDEERYRAYLQIFSCKFELKDYQGAIEAALMATTELPEWPDAYFMLQQLYYQVDDHDKSLEWYHVGRTKKNPETDSAFNPTVRLWQPMKLAAYSYAFSGQPKAAMDELIKLQRSNPDFPIEQGLKDEILRAVNEEEAIKSAKHLIDFNRTYEGDGLAVLNSLPAHLRSDIRLSEERRQLIPGKGWPKGSIAIYCGPSFEPWGPDTLDRGMGGSEEAVVYLSRELAKNGGDVTVYNERTNELPDYPVGVPVDLLFPITYYPWTEINPNDTFDIFVAWRQPSNLLGINARIKILDLHDVMPQEDVYSVIPHADYIFFKTKFHRNLYPGVPDEKAVIIGNGIKKEQFL